LLQLLAQVGIEDQCICGTVVSHESRVGASVAWEHGFGLCVPFSLGLDDLAVCASWVSGAGAGTGTAGYTACCNTRVACGGSENVGVRSHHNVGHHASRATSCDEDFGGIGVVLLDGVLDHVGETLVVATCIAGQTLCSVDFPAVVVFPSCRIDVDEAFLICEGVVLVSSRVSFASATTPMELQICQFDS